MDTSVRFENVSKRYNLGLTRTSVPSAIAGWFRSSFTQKQSTACVAENDFWALRNVSFELSRGESMAFVGSNGAGKTTALKLLANISKPTSGTITTNGKLSALIELGAGFHPDLTGRENIFLNGTILGLKRHEIEQRFDEIVAFSELERFIDTPVKRYSSGMTVRLGFAVASCIEPEILLVDEVLAVGDASFQQKCMRRIRSLVATGTSIIFVSHNLYLVQAVCERALYIEHGAVKYDGTTQEVIQLYEQDLHKAQAQKLVADGQTLSQNGSAASSGIAENEIEITELEVWGPNGPTSDALSSRQPAQIRIHYTAYADLGQVQMSLFLHRADGVNVGMARSKLDDVHLEVYRGKGMITLDLSPLQLVSGSYYAEAWFLDASDSLALTPHGCRSDWFSVIGKAMTYDGNGGIFEPIGQWAQYPETVEHGPPITLDIAEIDRKISPAQAEGYANQPKSNLK